MAEWILRRKRGKYFELYGKGKMLTNADVKHGVFLPKYKSMINYDGSVQRKHLLPQDVTFLVK